MESEQKTYEIGYLLTPLLPEDKAMEEVFALRKAIEDNSGLIMSEDRARMQKLAYPVKQNNSAYFGRIKFYAKPETAGGIKELVGKNDKVIRFLINGAAKEDAPMIPRKIRTIAKTTMSTLEKEEKKPIKPEEIDKKLKELIGE